MSAGLRKRLYRYAAVALGMLTMMFALEGMRPGAHSPWLGLLLVLIGIAAASACAVAAWRIDLDSAAQRHAQVRETLRDGGVRAVVGDPAWTLAALTAFALFCGWLAWSEAARGRIALALAPGAVAAVCGIGALWRWRVRASRRELRIDAAGVHSPDVGLIAWADIVGLRRYRMRVLETDSEGLQLLVRDPDRYIARLPAWQRRYCGLPLDGERFAPLLLPLDLYGIEVEPAYVAAVTLRRRVAAPFVDGWQPQMDQTEIDELLAACAPRAALPANGGAVARPNAPDAHLAAARRQLRYRTRQRRWRETAPVRAAALLATTLGYLALRAWSEGLFG
ncbi:hypothetical protein ACI2IY_02735 [Lysobacter enzymogenes]|uniref:hypothetical protein n=1 Tax=Lysobacter enzymogenes TaxID=69 RepID=UPI00384FEA5A